MSKCVGNVFEFDSKNKLIVTKNRRNKNKY